MRIHLRSGACTVISGVYTVNSGEYTATAYRLPIWCASTAASLTLAPAPHSLQTEASSVRMHALNEEEEAQ